ACTDPPGGFIQVADSERLTNVAIAYAPAPISSGLGLVSGGHFWTVLDSPLILGSADQPMRPSWSVRCPAAAYGGAAVAAPITRCGLLRFRHVRAVPILVAGLSASCISLLPGFG